MKITKLIAHRGDTVHFPENTLKSFLSAFKYGADGVELDIQLFKDDVVIVHDYLFSKNRKYPILKPVLNKIINKGQILIEIKSMNIKIIEKIAIVLAEFNKQNIELTTSVFPLMPYINKFFPKHRLGIILHSFLFQPWMNQDFITKKVISWAKLSNAQVVHIPSELINSNRIAKLHNYNLLVHSHIKKSQNQEKILSHFQASGVDQCTFDDIALLKYSKTC